MDFIFNAATGERLTSAAYPQLAVDTPGGKLQATVPVRIQYVSVSGNTGTPCAAPGGSTLKFALKPQEHFSDALFDVYTDAFTAPADPTQADAFYTATITIDSAALQALFPVAADGTSTGAVTLIGEVKNGSFPTQTFFFSVQNNVIKETEVLPNPAQGIQAYPVSSVVNQAVAEAALAPFAYRDYASECSAFIDGLLSGKIASAATYSLFTSADYAGGTSATRNAGVFTGGLDFSGFSFWNSTEGRLQGGVVLTSRHVLLAAHFSDPEMLPGSNPPTTVGSNPMTAGTTRLAFSPNDGSAPVSRLVTALNRIGTTDLLIATLDSDLPASVTPVAVLPGGLPSNFFAPGTAVLYGNADKEVHVAEIAEFPGGTLRAALAANRTFWTTSGGLGGSVAVVGDSGSPAYLVLGGRLVLWFLFHFSAGGGDLPGAHVAEINAVLSQAGNYALNVATVNVPPVPPGVGLLAAVNEWSQNAIFDGYATFTQQVYLGGTISAYNHAPPFSIDPNASAAQLSQLTLNAVASLPAAAPALAGRILFSGGHFYGCDGTAWKQLDN